VPETLPLRLASVRGPSQMRTTCHLASKTPRRRLPVCFRWSCLLRLVRTSAGSRQRYFRFIFSSSSMTFVLAGANLRAFIRCCGSRPRAFATSRRDQRPVYPTRPFRRQSDGCPCDGFDRVVLWSNQSNCPEASPIQVRRRATQNAVTSLGTRCGGEDPWRKLSMNKQGV
jgi:hypothetical protein